MKFMSGRILASIGVHFRSSASELHFNEMAIVHDLEKTQVVWILAVYRELHGVKGMDQSSVSN